MKKSSLVRCFCLLSVFLFSLSSIVAQSAKKDNVKESDETKTESHKWYSLTSKSDESDSVSVWQSMMNELQLNAKAMAPAQIKENYLFVDSIGMELMAKDSVQAGFVNRLKYKAIAMVDDRIGSSVWASFLSPIIGLLALALSVYSLLKLFLVRN